MKIVIKTPFEPSHTNTERSNHRPAIRQMNNSGKLFNNYKAADSQEQILQSCSFAGQLPGDSSTDESELLTGIMMVSVSESSQDYQTPPEHHSLSQNSSNDGHVPAPLDLQVKSDGPEMNDDSEPHGPNIVDLTIDSDHDDLQFTEEAAYVVEDDSLIVETNDTEQIDTGDSAENVVTEPIVTELVTSSSPVENAHKVFEQMPKTGDGTNTSATTADVAALNRGKRKLPFSIDSKDQTSEHNKGVESFTGIMDRVLGLLPKHDTHDSDADIDLIETAKMRGMTFPRPRWWPQEEGFKE